MQAHKVWHKRRQQRNLSPILGSQWLLFPSSPYCWHAPLELLLPVVDVAVYGVAKANELCNDNRLLLQCNIGNRNLHAIRLSLRAPQQLGEVANRLQLVGVGHHQHKLPTEQCPKPWTKKLLPRKKVVGL